MLRNGRLQKADEIAKRYLKQMSFWYPENALEDCKFRGRLRKTRVTCSCAMCGNPRKHRGEVTMQEKKQEEYLNDELESLDS